MINRFAHCLYFGPNTITGDNWLNNNIYLIPPSNRTGIENSQQYTDFSIFIGAINQVPERAGIYILSLALASNYPEYESLLGTDWNDKTYDFSNSKYIFSKSGSATTFNAYTDAIIDAIIDITKQNPQETYRILSRVGLLRSWLNVKHDSSKKFEQFIIVMIAFALNNPVYYTY